MKLLGKRIQLAKEYKAASELGIVLPPSPSQQILVVIGVGDEVEQVKEGDKVLVEKYVKIEDYIIALEEDVIGIL